jgi:hypothetical protein
VVVRVRGSRDVLEVQSQKSVVMSLQQSLSSLLTCSEMPEPHA